MIRDTLLTACLLYLTVFSFAQPICPNPNPDGAAACFGACIDCNIGQFSGNNYTQGAPPTLLVCGGTVTMHGPKWHAFIAGTPTVSFTISPSDCQGLEGLVAVITDFCDVERTLACYEGRPFGSQWPAIVTASGLQVGNVYQLGIGGKDGTTCQYTIDVTDGVAAPPPVGPISLIDGPTQVCPNAVAVYSISAASNALTYRWQAPPGASINGQGNIVNLTPSVGTQVTVTFGQVGGNICVRASNQCSVSPTQCL